MYLILLHDFEKYGYSIFIIFKRSDERRPAGTFSSFPLFPLPFGHAVGCMARLGLYMSVVSPFPINQWLVRQFGIHYNIFAN